MKATGIVRRIDDLGRVVVPKEIRKVLRIREGDPLEIYTGSTGEIILQKYSPIGDMEQVAKEFTESAASTLGATVAVSDADQYIAAAGKEKKQFENGRISSELDDIIQSRSKHTEDNKVIVPIVSHGDPVGSVTILSATDTTISDACVSAAEIGARFLAIQLLD